MSDTTATQGERTSGPRLPERSLRRALLALAGGLILGFTLLRVGAGVGPPFADPLWARLIVGGGLIGALGCSYLFERWNRSFDAAYQGSMYLLTAWIGLMIVENGFEADSIVVVALLPVISSVAFGAGLGSRRRFQQFHVFATAVPLVGVYVVADPIVDRLLFVVLFGVIMGLTYLLVEWQLDDRRSLERVNEQLEEEVERRAARERELEESRRRLTRAQKLADVGYWERDLTDGSLHWSNQVYRIFGLDPDTRSASHELLLERIPEEDRAEFTRMMEGVRSTEDGFEFEHRIVRPEGEERIVREQGVPVRDENGEVVRVRGSVLDITDLRLRDRQLETLYRLLRHDIRNHAGNVLGFLSMAEENPEADVFTHAESSARRIVQLTDSVHALMESLGEGTQEREAMDLGGVVEREMEEVGQAYPEADLRFDDSDREALARVDRLVGSVFRNLFYNAVQHSDRAEPTVEASVCMEDGAVRVRVADDGPGIPSEVRDRLFRQGAKGPESSGTGLGLYLVRTLVDQYGGEVRVEPNQPRGTVFVIELPRARPE